MEKQNLGIFLEKLRKSFIAIIVLVLVLCLISLFEMFGYHLLPQSRRVLEITQIIVVNVLSKPLLTAITCIYLLKIWWKERI